ncbi:MAG TPA: polysaccharide ABC transporter ATP-binding protein [Candidatus Sulfotelmatobacter sp.]|nr:polysaccharide ABC transporter ATP-binding protein [Candidatus Sulfotelmatobacter sp.]
MSNVVITAENLSKRYQRGLVGSSDLLRDKLALAFRAPHKLFRGERKESFWALKDVSFDVHQGEVIGLIGRNGSGKTTLLKVLSRITRPTAGWAEIHGRVGSLLEVGTGFHPELTGRENTYLSGSILGMSKGEIDRKFDEIVAFAEIEKFIDTPVKHYSSGMYVRLAFAVAAHLEPEILLVDEVLAVGDINFQKKCMGKMGEASRTGRTIVFVSHQMNQIRRLCGRVYWLEAGQICDQGSARDIIASYEVASATSAERQGDSPHCFLYWEIPGSQNTLHDGMDRVTLQFSIFLKEAVSAGHLGVNIFSDSEVLLGGWGFDDVNIPQGYQSLQVTFPFLPLKPGVYSIRCALFNKGNNLNGGQLVEAWEAAQPLVVDSAPLSHSQDRWSGLLNIPGSLSVFASSADASTIKPVSGT